MSEQQHNPIVTGLMRAINLLDIQRNSPNPSLMHIREAQGVLQDLLRRSDLGVQYDARAAQWIGLLQKLDMKPGQTLAVVLTLDHPSYPILEAAKDFISGKVPEGVKVVIFPRGTRVVNAEGIDYADLLRRYVLHVRSIAGADWLGLPDHDLPLTTGNIKAQFPAEDAARIRALSADIPQHRTEVDFAALLEKYIAHVVQVSETDWLPVTAAHGFTPAEIVALAAITDRDPLSQEVIER